MPRLCFVIMPFSATQSCSEEEWTRIFETLLKPAVEGAGLDYECKRSAATRGNLVAAIIRDLNDARVQKKNPFTNTVLNTSILRGLMGDFTSGLTASDRRLRM